MFSKTNNVPQQQSAGVYIHSGYKFSINLTQHEQAKPRRVDLVQNSFMLTEQRVIFMLHRKTDSME